MCSENVFSFEIALGGSRYLNDILCKYLNKNYGE